MKDNQFVTLAVANNIPISPKGVWEVTPMSLWDGIKSLNGLLCDVDGVVTLYEVQENVSDWFLCRDIEKTLTAPTRHVKQVSVKDNTVVLVVQGADAPAMLCWFREVKE